MAANYIAPAVLRAGGHGSGRSVTAVLGPTNTGKTHLAIERMLGHDSGLIGLPLRLLAREVYARLVARAGANAVALITGEEKIKPPNPRYWVSTVEAMPREIDVSFVAIDEVQLVADWDRGHVFTDAVLNRRGRHETMLMGSGAARSLLERLLPGLSVITRPRLSNLAFAGETKITRLPARSAIIAFSAEEVYTIAELVRRQRGGAAVVMGSLSPRTRNAQVAMFQAGEVDHIVATDAIGMGLNLEIGHVAFASDRKFDGRKHRRLHAHEFAQVAGRAGRAFDDGTFGTTGRCAPFDEDLIEALEGHVFDPLPLAFWRSSALDFSTLTRLETSLNRASPQIDLVRAPKAEDEVTLEIATGRPGIRDLAANRDDVRRLWDLCQLPDYRKVSPTLHADLVMGLFESIQHKGSIDQDWYAREIRNCDRLDGDIDALAWRLAHMRTWSYCANRPDWLRDPVHWQNVTRALEDRLSDALHEKLMQRFVDRRTSVLLRRLKENAMSDAEVTATGEVIVEGQNIGRLAGFRFTPDPSADGTEAKALRAVASKALASEIEMRATRLSTANDEQFALSLDGVVRFIGEPIAALQAGAKPLEPRFVLLADEELGGIHREMVETRLGLWVKAHVQKHLGPLFQLEQGEGLTGIARGIGFRLAEQLGVIDRSLVAADVRSLDQNQRGELRKLGVRFGAHHLFVPALMKPGPRSLAAQLHVLATGGDDAGLKDVSHLAYSGRTSIPVDAAIAGELYRIAGYKVAGPRAIRIDILERLADLIRPAIAYRPGVTSGEPPAGAADGDSFVVTGAMTSLVGAAGQDFADVLRALGYRSESRKGPAITVPLKPAAALEPIKPIDPETSAEASVVSTADTDAHADISSDVSEGENDLAPLNETSPIIEAMSETPSADPSEDAAPLDAVPAETVAPAPVTEDAVSKSAVSDDAVSEPEVAVLGDLAPLEELEGVPTEEPAVVEIPIIEVWRMGRPERPRHERPRHSRPPSGDRANPADRPAPGDRTNPGERRPPRVDGRPGDKPWHRGPRPAQPAQSLPGPTPVDGAVSPPPAEAPRRHQDARRDKREAFGRFGDKPRQGESPQGRPEGRPQGGKPWQERGPGGGNRRDKDRGGGAEHRPYPMPQPERPKVPDKPVDPDSPFAKLAALKAKLEGKS
ncbi:DEXQc_Suv3 domain containing protein [Rhabdaerophilaceae bacterium]